MAKLSSLALLATGLFIMWRGQGSDLAAIGWLFVAVGVLALGFNLYVTVKGPQGPGN
jgi:Na+/phosphate symporter